MAKSRWKKNHNIVIARCDFCGEYACYGDDKGDYCSKCVKPVVSKKGTIFEKVLTTSKK